MRGPACRAVAHEAPPGSEDPASKHPDQQCSRQPPPRQLPPARHPRWKRRESRLSGWSARPDLKETSCQPLCAHLVLTVHRRDVEDLRVLAAVRVLGAVVEMQSAHLVAPKRAARDHALHGLFQNALREAALEHFAGGHFLEPAWVARVLVIELLLQLAAGEADLVGVDHHYMVAAIDVRRVARLVLAAQD